MYFKIPKNIALRSWPRVPYAYYAQYDPYAHPLSKKEFETMLRCDGEQDVDLDATVASLLIRKLIVICEKGERPSDWSGLKTYENRYFPKMNLMITGKCNYNCLHCFNAADNAPLMTEWTFEALCDLFDQARDCGIHALTITGGEPMAHKRFMDILREIHRRGMFVEELNTNGYYITQETLEQMKEMDCRPLIKISFDGIGCHDWMRNRKGAEESTLRAMGLCVENGFRVKAQTQVHRKNVHVMLPTARVLNGMGVSEMRVIRTTEAPRWAANAGDACLDIEEYYEKLLAFAREYMLTNMQMDIDIWQFLRLYPKQKSFRIVPVICNPGEYRDSLPTCRGNRGMAAVASSGDLVPCMQLSGLLEQLNIHLGNLHRQKLRDLLSRGPYLDNVCATVGDVKNSNAQCAACKWFSSCAGGCRALGLLHSGERRDFLGEDKTKCVFFKKGWYEKTSDALREWQCLSRISME